MSITPKEQPKGEKTNDEISLPPKDGEEEPKHSIENDKRYEEPFEDDGAYAD